MSDQVRSSPSTPPLRTEAEIEAELDNRTGLLRNIRISPCERKKFTILGAMFFIIGFIYSFMRILKDMFVMERQDPNCFNFIKIFYILPLSFAIVFLINYLLPFKTVSKIFNYFLIFFGILFLIYGTLLNFEQELMFDSEAIKDKYEDSNSMIKYFMYTIAEPLATLIYITAELWGSIILSYLFLSYLNECCTIGQHSRFIPPLFIVINFALLTSAIATTGMRMLIGKFDDEQKIMMMSGIFFIEALLTLGIYVLKYYIEKWILPVPLFIPRSVRRPRRSNSTMSLKESLQIMKRSKFLLAMCSIVFFYNVIVNLLETVFKLGIKAAAKAEDKIAYQFSAKLNNYDQYITSLTVITLNLTQFSNLTNIRGWTFVGMLTPIIGVIGIIFILGFGSYNSAVEGNSFGIFNSFFKGGSTNYFLENYIGVLVMAGLKIFKFTAFDVTKEKISMRIDQRYRPKFKSIYDGIFNKLGKSVGSVYSIIINAIFMSINPRGFSPVTLFIATAVILGWVSYIYYLGKSFDDSLKDNKNVNIDLAGEEEDDDLTLVDDEINPEEEENLEKILNKKKSLESK